MGGSLGNVEGFAPESVVNKALQSADKMINEEIAKASSGLLPGIWLILL